VKYLFNPLPPAHSKKKKKGGKKNNKNQLPFKKGRKE
jgi:hypothetical protein